MRTNGVLMHISSLPSPYGIGTLGQAAREFADFLSKSGQSSWQMLPICPTGYGDSPYQSYSTFAGNPYFIDLDQLAADGLLLPEEYRNVDWESTPDRVNYGVLYEKRYPILRKAALRLLAQPNALFDTFCAENGWWLDDYALFMALKDAENGRPSWEWAAPIRRREETALAAARETYAQQIAVWKVYQYLFFKQWRELKAYVNGLGIQIIGDLPIYVSRDSVDVWATPDLFQIDENGDPTDVAGCPPDGFSATGQLWGNPLYDWNRMAQDRYSWWMRRIEYLCNVYDILRIDHFRAFDEYYAIPFGSADASPGCWKPGPGKDFFRVLKERLGELPIIAEDLGFVTDSVRELLHYSGCPGMKVLQFAFDSRDSGGPNYIPHNYPVHCVAYVGTHDNDTAAGWMTSAAPEDVEEAVRYLCLNEEEGFHWGLMRGLWSSVAERTIVQAQDLLGLGSDTRMNTPSTMGKNWQWRSLPGVFDDALAQKLYRCMTRFGRIKK